MSTTASPFAALLHTPCPLAPSLCVGVGDASSLAELRAPALLTPTLGYLRQLLQTCVEIEHSTIPLYLTAAWSMDDNKSFAYNVTHGVAIEEMLHMTDAANLLNAIGGAPDIDQPSFVPRYPIVMPIINVSSSIASFSRRTYGTFEKDRRGKWHPSADAEPHHVVSRLPLPTFRLRARSDTSDG